MSHKYIIIIIIMINIHAYQYICFVFDLCWALTLACFLKI